jgi:hypothetical protein
MVAVSSTAMINDPSRKVTGANNAFGVASPSTNNTSNGNGRAHGNTSVRQQQMDSARHRPLPQIEPHEQVIFIEDNLLPECTARSHCPVFFLFFVFFFFFLVGVFFFFFFFLSFCSKLNLSFPQLVDIRPLLIRPARKCMFRNLFSCCCRISPQPPPVAQIAEPRQVRSPCSQCLFVCCSSSSHSSMRWGCCCYCRWTTIWRAARRRWRRASGVWRRHIKGVILNKKHAERNDNIQYATHKQETTTRVRINDERSSHAIKRQIEQSARQCIQWCEITAERRVCPEF